MEVKQKVTMQQKMWDIIVDVKWASISTKYFGKSRSWLSQKMNGKDGNGSDVEFSESEKETLRQGLRDLASRINACADKI